MSEEFVRVEKQALVEALSKAFQLGMDHGVALTLNPYLNDDKSIQNAIDEVWKRLFPDLV